MAAKDVRARLRLPAGGVNVGPSMPIAINYGERDEAFAVDSFPCKEWCVTDDMMNLCDAASCSIANDNGENSGKFSIGQRVEIEESDPDVANGQWVRHFTGIVTSIETYSDLQGGSNILLQFMDLAFHLSGGGKAQPLIQIKRKKFGQLLDAMIDPSWGIGQTEATNDLNKRLKHGRQVIIQNHRPVLGAVLPFIQVEPGQSPIDIIQTYAAREGVLVNMSADGHLVFFRPHYDDQALYTAVYRKTGDPAASENNVRGRPTLREQIDGVFSEMQCWSTVAIPPEIQNTENPNEQYRHFTYVPSDNPLPFNRREVISDPEAINDQLRKNRAIWKQQLGLFYAWTYEVEFYGHSQDGAFFVSDTMISVDDQVNKVSGVYYVQSVRRSSTLGGGVVTRLTIRKPGLLNPELTTLTIGGGAKKAAKKKKPVK